MLHGTKSYLLQDENGQVVETHSISAGLDYPGVGPEHSYYKETGRADYVSITDDQALEGFRLFYAAPKELFRLWKARTRSPKPPNLRLPSRQTRLFW